MSKNARTDLLFFDGLGKINAENRNPKRRLEKTSINYIFLSSTDRQGATGEHLGKPLTDDYTGTQLIQEGRPALIFYREKYFFKNLFSFVHFSQFGKSIHHRCLSLDVTLFRV